MSVNAGLVVVSPTYDVFSSAERRNAHFQIAQKRAHATHAPANLRNLVSFSSAGVESLVIPPRSTDNNFADLADEAFSKAVGAEKQSNICVICEICGFPFSCGEDRRIVTCGPQNR